MRLNIDGFLTTATPDQTLRDILATLNMDNKELSQRPLAAKIAGEVFNLNYIPVRSKDSRADRPSIRRAMAASGGNVHLLRYADPTGKDVYTRTAQFVLFLAIHRLWPKAKAVMTCSLGPALYIRVEGVEDFCANQLKEQVVQLVASDIPLVRNRITTQDAIQRFEQLGETDKANLLKWRQQDFFDVYSYDGFMDYYYGELAPSTGYLSVWEILPCEGGFFFVFPDDQNPNQVAQFCDMPKIFSVFNEGDRWGELMECRTVADLNNLTASDKIRELIRVNEALHEKRFSQIADEVCKRGARAVLLSGPSSSGKTTSANRLATQLRIHGKKPVLMGLDDYYIDRDQILPGPDGKMDFEHINTIDTELFGQHLKALLSGENVEIPHFNFISGKREWHGHIMRMDENTVIIVEGLHALNPVLLQDGLPADAIFRLYVSPLIPLNLDDHNRIPTSYLRLLRRIVRDIKTRGSSAQRTLDMWDSVRRGEKKWIFPYQENADVVLNSSTLYELAVLKKHVYPILTAIEPEDPCYEQARAIVKILNFVEQADVDDEIPPTSIVREFIGGNSFYK